MKTLRRVVVVTILLISCSGCGEYPTPDWPVFDPPLPGMVCMFEADESRTCFAAGDCVLEGNSLVCGDGSPLGFMTAMGTVYPECVEMCRSCVRWVTLCGPDLNVDEVERFTEEACVRHAWGKFRQPASCEQARDENVVPSVAEHYCDATFIRDVCEVGEVVCSER